MENMPNVKDITELLDSPSGEDIALVEKAYSFAEKAHEGHQRNSGEPYFTHLFETAKGLAELGMDAKTITAGFLHDSIEDVSVKPETIEKEFGPEVLFLVEGVTKLGTLKYRGLKRHTESLRRLFVATSQDIRVLIIKLMDRLHNMKTLSFVPKEKRRRIALETLEVYAPIADRLGMGQLRQELEDLSFPYIDPAGYRKAQKLLKQKSTNTQRHLEKVHKSLKKEFAKENIRNFRTEYRIKGLYSLYQKLERKEGDIEKVHDVAALRIIVPTVSDCYKVLGIIHGMWRPLPGKIKDYIAFPKPNGYQSIHTTIFAGDGGIVEIQIRTDDMHRKAQYGIAAHFGYKEEGSGASGSGRANLLWIKQLIPSLLKSPFGWGKESKSGGKKPDFTQAPTWVRDIVEAQGGNKNTTDFIDRLKTDFFSHRVFVFTPKGDVIDLPVDSSPVDFAYAIHSDIGNHMAGARVNGKMVALDTKLKNGDIVEIVTKPSSSPTQKWLDIAKTALARKHILSLLETKKKLD